MVAISSGWAIRQRLAMVLQPLTFQLCLVAIIWLSPRNLQYRRSIISLSVFLWNDLADPVFDGVRLAGFMSRANDFFIGISCSILLCLGLFSLSLLSFSMLVLCGYGLWTDRV